MQTSPLPVISATVSASQHAAPWVFTTDEQSKSPNKKENFVPSSAQRHRAGCEATSCSMIPESVVWPVYLRSEHTPMVFTLAAYTSCLATGDRIMMHKVQGQVWHDMCDDIPCPLLHIIDR